VLLLLADSRIRSKLVIFVAVDYSFIYFIGQQQQQQQRQQKQKQKRREERIFQHIDSPDEVITNTNRELSCDA